MPDPKQLIRRSLAARKVAYAPYSGFPVGAALLAEDGRVFDGCNVENASFALTICAERVAMGTAIAAGCRSFRAIAVATRGGHAPCGACRQMLSEFSPKLLVILVDADRPENCSETTVDQLLPAHFRLPHHLAGGDFGTQTPPRMPIGDLPT